jgi:hypothetical protein
MSEDQLVSWRLEQLERRVASMDAKIDSMATDMAGWKGKASAWGSAWGLIGGALMSFLVSVAARLYTGNK